MTVTFYDVYSLSLGIFNKNKYFSARGYVKILVCYCDIIWAWLYLLTNFYIILNYEKFQKNIMVEVIVEYDYTAKEPNELTIKKGDIIKDVVKKTGGWWEGILKDKKGVFPDNFVRPIDKESVTLRSRKDASRIRQCRVVFSYSPLHEDELKLNAGDVINVIGEEEEGWWRGLLNGKEGVFPSNFVEEIINPPKPATRDEPINIYSEIDVKAPKLPNKPAKQLCEVKYSYKAQNDDELTIKKGDIITLLSKDQQDPGWWKGELNGVVGVFPDNFVALIPDGKNSLERRSEKKGDGDKKSNDDVGAMKVTSIASQRQSLEPKIEKSSSESTTKSEKNNNEPPPINKTPPIPGKKPTIPIKKSPSSSSAGLFSEIKKKFVDVVDGGISSKSSTAKTESSEVRENSADNIFDQVERKQLLTDVRATRVKAPGRRLPSTIYKDDDQPNILNGNVEHLLDTSDASHNTSSSSEPDEKPRLREWEKHKAPWLEEMKANQAKRTSTSPGPPSESRIKLTPTGEMKNEDKDDATPPSEKEVDMSKSMPPMDLSKSLSTSKPKPPPPSDKVEDKVPAIKTKPIIPPNSSVRQALAHRDPTASNRHSVNVPNSVPKDSLPSAAKLPTTISPKVPATIPPSNPPIAASKSSSPSIAQKANKDKSKAETSDTVSMKQYEDVLERLQKLEALVEKQQEALEDLKNKLQVESDLRMLLQEKIADYEV